LAKVKGEEGKGIKETTEKLSMTPKMPTEEDNAWMMHEVHLCDYEQQKVIWERKSASGSYLDVFIPQSKTISHSEFEPDDDGDEDDDEAGEDIISLYKVPSVDGKYMLGFNPDKDFDEGK